MIYEVTTTKVSDSEVGIELTVEMESQWLTLGPSSILTQKMPDGASERVGWVEKEWIDCGGLGYCKESIVTRETVNGMNSKGKDVMWYHLKYLKSAKPVRVQSHFEKSVVTYFQPVSRPEAWGLSSCPLFTKFLASTFCLIVNVCQTGE